MGKSDGSTIIGTSILLGVDYVMVRRRKGVYTDQASVTAMRGRPAIGRISVVTIFVILMSLVMGLLITAPKTPTADADFVRHIICSWGWVEGDDADAEAANIMRPAVIYQLTETSDLQKAWVYKSAANASTDNTEKSWYNMLAGRDFNKSTLDILNNQNKTTKKYTAYDRFGFSGLKWSNYMGEWNWIKVYYCGADGHSDSDKDPEDPKINLYYEGRNRPLDQWNDRASSRDPRVSLSATNKLSSFGENIVNGFANFLFSITKAAVAFNNMLFTKSMSNLVKDFKLDELVQKIMVQLFNNLFMSLIVMMIALLAVSIMYKAFIKRQFRQALTEIAKALAIVFVGFLMMANPKFFVNLPNYAGLFAQYLTISVTTSSLTDNGETDLCSVETNGSVAGDKNQAPQLFKNGKFNNDAISDWLDDLGDSVSRKVTCKYWDLFALTPWSMGQYGITYNYLWAKGKAPQSNTNRKNYEIGYHPDTNTKSDMPDYPGLASVPLGNNQVFHNWAIYQISTQSTAHIPGDISDPKTGAIREKPDKNYTKLGELETRNRQIDSTNGDWWRVVDAMSGYDTKARESSSSSSSSSGGDGGSGSSSIDKALDWAKKIAADDSHGYSQTHRTGPDYDCSSFVYYALKQAGFNLGINYPFATGIMAQTLEKAGFKKVDNPDLNNFTNLKPGDVLLCHNASCQHTGFYLGGGKTVEAHHDESGGIVGAQQGDQKGDEISVSNPGGFWGTSGGMVYRYGNGATSTSTYDSDSGNSYDVYTPKDKSQVTEWWVNWIGGDAWQRLTISIMGLVACIALIGPIALGITILAASIMSVVLMVFAPVVLTLSIVPNIGNTLLTRWGGMLWGTVVKRGVIGIVYMLMIVVTSNIMQGVLNIGDYLKSILLIVLAGIVFLTAGRKMVDMIMSKLNVNASDQVAQKTNKILRSTGKIGGAAALGAVSAVKRVKSKDVNGDDQHEFKKDKDGNLLRDNDGNLIKDKKVRRFSGDRTIYHKHGKHKGEEKRDKDGNIKERGALRQVLHQARLGAMEGAGATFNREIQQTQLGRQFANNVERGKARINQINGKDELVMCQCSLHDTYFPNDNRMVRIDDTQEIRIRGGKNLGTQRWCNKCIDLEGRGNDVV